MADYGKFWRRIKTNKDEQSTNNDEPGRMRRGILGGKVGIGFSRGMILAWSDLTLTRRFRPRLFPRPAPGQMAVMPMGNFFRPSGHLAMRKTFFGNLAIWRGEAQRA